MSVAGRPVVCDLQRRFYKAGSLQDDEAAQVSEFLSRYKDHPWEYLDSEGESNKTNTCNSLFTQDS